MYLEMPGEKLSDRYDSLTNEEIKNALKQYEETIENQRKEIEEKNKVIKGYEQDISDYKKQVTGDLAGGERSERSSNDQAIDSDFNVDNVRFYMWGGRERLEKDNVLNVIKSLNDPYKSEIYEFVKNNNVLGLQKYLNGKIDAQEIDVSKLREALSTRRIWLNGDHILEDGKFGPQTLETIKFLVKESNDNSDGVGDRGSSAGTVDKGNGSSTGTLDRGNDGGVGTTGDEEPLEKYEGNLPNGMASTIREHIDNSEELKNLLKTGNSEDVISMYVLGPKLYMSLGQTCITEINLAECLDENGNFNDNQLKQKIIPEAIENLVNQKKAWITLNFLLPKKYTKEDIFGDDFGENGIKAAKVSNFFNEFKNNKLRFYNTNGNKSCMKSGENVNLTFNSKGKIPDYSRWDKNPDLIFNCADLVDSDYNVNEEKIKLKLKSIIEKIIEREDFK